MSASAKPVEKALKSFLAIVLAVSFCPLIPAEKAQAQETGDSNEPAAPAQAAEEGGAGAADPDTENPAPMVENDSSDDDDVALLSDASGDPIVKWTECGTCQWMINSEGCLVIKPNVGLEAGTLDWESTDHCVPWRQNGYSDHIVSVKVENGVVAPADVSSMFDGCSKMKFADLSSLDTSGVQYMGGGWRSDSGLISTSKGMFAGCSSLVSLDLSSFDTSMVISMSSMFEGCSSLKSLNLTNWNTSKVKDMSSMFEGCSSFEFLDLSQFDTSEVLNMGNGRGSSKGGIFSGCASLRSLNISSWNTSNVTSMRGMFEGCTSLESFDLPRLDTSKVKDMSSMFEGCTSLKSLNLSKIDTSKVENMNSMFQDCSSITSLDLSMFDTSSVRYMGRSMDVSGDGMFSGCTSLQSLNLSNWDTSKVFSMVNMFANCSSLELLDLSQFDFSSVNSMAGMLYRCSGLRSVSINETFKTGSVFPTPSGDGLTGRWVSSADGIAYTPNGVPSNVTATYTAQQEGDVAWNQVGTCLWRVDNAGTLTIKPLSGYRGELPKAGYGAWPWKETSDDVKAIVVQKNVVAPAKNSGMFSNFSYLKSADLSGLDTSSMTDMRSMFYGCKSLRKINAPGFSTSEVTDMSSMFSGCSSLESLDLSSFNTSKVTDMSSMFSGCSSLATLDVSTFDTSKVTDMRWMFSNCSFLKNLDLSKFNTSKVTDMSGLFYGCNALKTITFGTFDTSKSTSMNAMFYNCSSLELIDSLRFDTSRVLDMSFMFSGCNKLGELDLSTFDTSCVTNMGSMFQSCSMVHLDLSGFDTSSVTDMSYMFNSSSIQNLDLSTFDTSHVTKMNNMFGSGSSLRSVALGDKFTFNGRDTSRICSLPVPRFANATGLWASSADGKAYTPDSIPNNVAATYTAQVKGETPKTVITKSMFAVDTGAKTYTGLKIMPEVSSNTLRKGTDYTVSYGENVNAGTGSVTVTGAGSYTGTLSYSFTINKAAPSYTVPSGLSAVYGQTLSDVTLPAGFSWQDDASAKVGDVGRKTFLATYTPVDAVNYETVSGIEVDLNVTPGTLDEDDFFFDLSDAVYTGEPVVGRVSSKTLVERTDYDVAYADNVKAGTASVTVTGIGNYEGSKITKRFTVKKADPSYDVPDSISAVEGQTLGDLGLPVGFAWQDDPATGVGDAGEHSFMATFTPGDTANYNVVEDVPVTVVVTAGDDAAGWNPCGDCVWKIDGQGCLVIKPANGVSGTLENWAAKEGGREDLVPPWAPESDSIRSVKVEGKVFATCVMRMFGWCRNLESVDLSGLDTSMASLMGAMFAGCVSLKSLDLSNLDTSHARVMEGMFSGCVALEDLDLSGFDTAFAESMSNMFDSCQSLRNVKLGASFTFSGSGTERLCSLPTPWRDGSTGLWRDSGGQIFAPSEVPDGAGTYTAAFPELADGWKAIGDCAWKVDDRGCLVIKPANGVSGTLENYTTNVENYAGNLMPKTPWEDRSDDIVSARFEKGVTAGSDLGFIFWQLCKLESVDFSNLDMSNVRSMRDAFRCCESLKRIDGLGSKGGVALEDATEMFSLCRSLKAVDLNNIDLSGLDSAGWMFSNCSSLEELDLSGLGAKSSQYRYLSGMLYGCSSLERVDLSGLDTRGALSMRDMFSGCTSLENVALGENFSFSGAGPERLCSLPTPERDGFEGKWRNAAGETFAPSEVPDGAGAYTAVFPEHPDGWTGCGTCMWTVEGGQLVIKPINGESGELAEWGDDGVAPLGGGALLSANVRRQRGRGEGARARSRQRAWDVLGPPQRGKD